MPTRHTAATILTAVCLSFFPKIRETVITEEVQKQGQINLELYQINDFSLETKFNQAGKV